MTTEELAKHLHQASIQQIPEGKTPWYLLSKEVQRLIKIAELKATIKEAEYWDDGTYNPHLTTRIIELKKELAALEGSDDIKS